MFSNILFLILVLMTLSYAPEAQPLLTPGWGLIYGGGLYGLLLIVLYFQKGVTALANVELIIFFLVYHFVFGAQRLYAGNSLFLLAIVSVALYFLGLFIHHLGKMSAKRAILQVRFLMPFVIPFLCFNLITDLLPDGDNPIIVGGMLLASLLFFGLLMLFYPTIIQAIWGCRLLPKSPLKERLDELCKRTKFRHAGMKTWPVMRHTITAAILGMIGKWRYVMFTEGLIKELPPEEIEAVLAHEIGHSRKKHMLFFPVIFLGMFVLLGLWGAIITGPLEHLFERYPKWDVLEPLFFFVPYAIILLLYYRFVFGYFSRLFERQADLFVFEANVPVGAMIAALDRIGTLSGNTHHLPSWHHYGIGQRIAFLRQAENRPELIEQHDRRIRRALWVYASCCLLLLLLAIGYPLLS